MRDKPTHLILKRTPTSNSGIIKMKTLKSLKEESRKFYAEKANVYFSKSFNKKMGGTQTIRFEDNFLPEIEIDEREYYSGRGAKYNNDSMHEHIDVFVSKKEFEERVNQRATNLYDRLKNKSIASKALRNFCKENQLNAKNYYFFSENSAYFKFEKKSDVEKELNINLSEFFNTTGKTYYFADTKIGLLMFFHNHHQSYSFEIVNEEKKQEFLAERESWVNAPYAKEVGQTDNINLYVC